MVLASGGRPRGFGGRPGGDPGGGPGGSPGGGPGGGPGWGMERSRGLDPRLAVWNLNLELGWKWPPLISAMSGSYQSSRGAVDKLQDCILYFVQWPATYEHHH